LVIKRNEGGRTIFYSTSSNIFYDNDNQVFSQFGRFRLSNGKFYGTLDKLSIWDIPLSDNDFDEHVNDLNSYGYSGSVSYQHLWVKLSWDYPQDMYFNISNSSVVWVDNYSPYYQIPNYYVDNYLNSINPTLYSASLEIIENVWQPFYPTGSVDIFAYNFPKVIENSFSASWMGYPECMWNSQSIYPYHFEELTYEQNIDSSKFGPNKYKNNKINTVSYTLNARLDPKDRSTNQPDITISGESNQLGLFIDPQDSKNKDIIRYVGKSGIMDFISDPSDLYKHRYKYLVNKNYEYNLNGNKKTLFNELLTVYKFYFDKSVFNAIKNILPARSNVYTGVVIEPTILERPKYQNRPITSSIYGCYKESVTIDKVYRFKSNLLSADFNTDFSLVMSGSSQQQNLINSLPLDYNPIFNLKYLKDPNRIWQLNLTSDYISDYMDPIQHNLYPDFELLSRNWETSSLGIPLSSDYTTPIYGSISSRNGYENLEVGPDTGVNYPSQYFSGFNQGNHPIIYYMIKIWEKYYYYAKTGEYVKSSNPLDNTYDSSSVYLYKYVVLNEYYMRNLIYFTNLISLPMYNSSDISYTYNSIINSYLHKSNTFLNTPDQTVSNVIAVPNALTPITKTIFDLNLNPDSFQFFELARGYPRNHYTHKLQQFSKKKYGTYYQTIFIKGQQTSNSTINTNGINDGSSPIESSNVNNMNIINSSNIIQNIPSSNSGKVTPN